MIEIRGLTKIHGSTTVLHGVDIDLPKGGVTALIGPNGAGKSTMLTLIGRLIDPDGGTISVDGLDVGTTRSDVLAKRLSILPQENRVAARLTVRDLVAFGRYPWTGGRLTDYDLAQVERSLGWMQILDLADRFLDTLSGGQRQRAFVAMVLCQDTDYVLLDEPLNNLDMKHAASMMRFLRRAAEELGKTVVVVLHDINLAARHSDLIVAMKDGRILRTGTSTEIMRPEVLAEIYDIEARIEMHGGIPVCVSYD